MNLRLLFILFCFAFLSCNNNHNNSTPIVEEEGFDYGTIKNGRYINKFFDIQVDVPKGWAVQTQEQAKQIMEVGAQAVAKDDEMLQKAIKASEVNTANLLTVFEHEPGAAVDFNPNYMLIAENLKNFPGIKSGKEYLFHSRKILVNANIPYTHIDEEFEKEIVGGFEFYKLNASAEFAGIPVHQLYMACVKDGFVICFISSYSDDMQKERLEKIKNSIKPYKSKDR